MLIPSNLDPTKVWVLPKVWKGPKGHELRCNGCNSRVGPQADSLKEIQKSFSKNWGDFSNKKCLGEVGPEAYGILSHPHLFFLIFLDSMSNPKTSRTFRQEIGVSRLTWKLSKHFSLVMFAQCRGGLDPGRGFRVDIVDWLEGKGSYMGVSENSDTPKSSILIGFSIVKTIHFGVPLFLETPISQSHPPKSQRSFFPSWLLLILLLGVWWFASAWSVGLLM